MRQYQIRDQIEAFNRAQSRSRQLQAELALAIEASELGTFHWEISLNHLVWNDRCKAHFWLPPDAEVDLERFFSILHPDDREPTRQAIDACLYGGERFDVKYRAVSPAGEIRWLRATGRAFSDPAGNPVRLDGTTQDVTERERTEQNLRETQDRFQAMANAIPQLAWMASPDGWIFWYNQRWYDYCGTTPEDMEGWGWQKVHDPAELPRSSNGGRRPWRRASSRWTVSAAAPRRRVSLAPDAGRAAPRRRRRDRALVRHEHRHHRGAPQGGRAGAAARKRAGGARRGRAGEPDEGRVPRHAQPRAAHAAERDPRVVADPARRRAAERREPRPGRGAAR